MKRIRYVIFISLLFTARVFAEISANTLFEYQYGNLPETNPKYMSTLYSQINIKYTQNHATAGLRYQNFAPEFGNSSYSQLSQRYFEWQQGPVKLTLGNFYTTVGRGLVLRAFELPNVIFEQRQFRKRYGFYRDIDGALITGQWDKIEVTAFNGKPLDNTFPPKIKYVNARYGTMQGGQITARPVYWYMIGGGYVHTDFPNKPKDYQTIFTQLSLKPLLEKAHIQHSTFKVYAEHARENAKSADFFSRDSNNPHASYLSINLSYKQLGISAEYKDYQKFENLVNLPPVLYMEHSYYLLNRVTHELLSENEKGFQYEVTVKPAENIYLLVNTSFAKNQFSNSDFTFKDRMLEATINWTDAISSKTFYNWSKDTIRGESSRKTGGINLEWNFYNNWGFTLDAQQQNINNLYYTDSINPYSNTYLAATISIAPRLSISTAWDRSTDPLETDKWNTPFKIENAPVNWFSLTGALQINMSHEIQFFYGKRRGGLACLSGTCYEVLPFNGMELRWTGSF